MKQKCPYALEKYNINGKLITSGFLIYGDLDHVTFIFSGKTMYRTAVIVKKPNFDPKHGFLSSVEAEIISFCQRRQPFAFSAFYVHPLTFEGGSPSKFDK